MSYSQRKPDVSRQTSGEWKNTENRPWRAKQREKDKEAAGNLGRRISSVSVILLQRSRTAGSVIDCINFPVCHGTRGTTKGDEKRLQDGKRESEGESRI